MDIFSETGASANPLNDPRELQLPVQYNAVAFGCGERTAQDDCEGRKGVSTVWLEINF